jgi:hypothetical protein
MTAPLLTAWTEISCPAGTVNSLGVKANSVKITSMFVEGPPLPPQAVRDRAIAKHRVNHKTLFIHTPNEWDAGHKYIRFWEQMQIRACHAAH